MQKLDTEDRNTNLEGSLSETDLNESKQVDCQSINWSRQPYEKGLNYRFLERLAENTQSWILIKREPFTIVYQIP